jgi:thioesterase superfamily protein 4
MFASRKDFTPQEPSSDTKTHFSSAPWAALLFKDPSLQAFSNESRIPKPSTAETFTSKTLATDDTISAWQSFYKAPRAEGKFCEVVSLLSLGSGVNGHIDTCHGGFVSAILDEVIGTAAEYERPTDKSTMTAYLKVEYKKPVRTPAVILCRAALEKREGRKLWGRGTVEDGEGTILATGEALFVIVERVKPLEKL